MMGFDFADPERGISGTVRPSGAAVLFDHDRVIAASPEAAAELGNGGGATGVALELDGVAAQLELSPLGGALNLRGERTGSEELAVCRVTGSIRENSRDREISCLGIRSDAATDPDPGQVSVTRSIAVAFSDGGILALRAARPAEAADHGDEETVAALAGPDGEVTEVREPLLSTQYDGSGRHVRATLELWPEQAEEPRPPARAAGTIVCGTSLPFGDKRLHVAFFRWSMGGRPGLGRYEVLSAQSVD